MRAAVKPVLALTGLFVIALVALKLLLPVDAMKREVITRLEAATGRTVNIGSMSLSVLPDIALEASDVTLSNPAWAGGGHMADIKLLRLGVEFAPLLHKEIRLTELTLDSPVIALVQRGNQANWQMTPQNAAPTPAVAAARSEATTDNFLSGLSLENIHIKNASISYLDGATHASQSIAGLNVSLQAPHPQEQVAVNADALYGGRKVSLDLVLGTPLTLGAGAVSNVALKGHYGTMDFQWQGTLAVKKGIVQLGGRLGIGELDPASLSPQKEQDNVPALPAPRARAAANVHWSDAPVSLAFLKMIDASLAVTIEKLVLPRATIGHIQTAISLQNGLLNMTVSNLAAYDGALSFALAASSNGGISFAGAARGVNAEKLLHDTMGMDTVSGTLGGQVQITTVGLTRRALIGALNGKGDFALKNGAIKGVNLLDMAKNIASAFTFDTGNSTAFSDLSGSYTIRNGVVTNTDLRMDSSALRMTGLGVADLPQWQLNYTLNPMVAASIGGNDTGIIVPIRVYGPIDHPVYRADLKAAITDNLINNPKNIGRALGNKASQFINNGGLNNLLR